MKCWFEWDLGAGLDHPATVDYSDCPVFVALDIDTLDPVEVGDQAQQAKPIVQDFEPAGDLLFALVMTATEFLAAVPGIPGLVEAVPKQGVVESQSSLRTTGS
jgi:hypothetical protein